MKLKLNNEIAGIKPAIFLSKKVEKSWEKYCTFSYRCYTISNKTKAKRIAGNGPARKRFIMTKLLTENNLKNFTLDTFPGVTLSDGSTCYKLIDCRDYADDSDWTFTETAGLDEDDNEVTEEVTVDRPTEGYRLLPVYSYTYDADRDLYIDEGGEDTADTEDDEIDFADDVYGESEIEWCKEAAEKEAEELRYAKEVTDVTDLVGLCVSDSGADMLGIK